jgi:hypothetical protein
MTRADLLALAERFDRAEEAETHRLMWEALDALALPRSRHYSIARHIAAGAFLEAAASLVPAEMFPRLFFEMPQAIVLKVSNSRYVEVARANGMTPALALTAAALRARAQEAGDE